MLVGAGSAQAGGATFSFSGRFVWPGQTVTGTAQFFPFSQESDGAPVVDERQKGPFFVYLCPTDHSCADQGRLLAQLDIVPATPGQHNANARVTFTVPRVAYGVHYVSICDDPCTDNILGDLIGGWVHVVKDETESRLVRLEERLTDGFDQRVAELESNLGPRIDRVQRADLDRGADLGTRIDNLSARLLALEGRVAGLKVPDPEGHAPAPLWGGGWPVAMAIAVLWGVTVLRRRREPGAAVRDGIEGGPPDGDHLLHGRPYRGSNEDPRATWGPDADPSVLGSGPAG